MKCFLWVWFVLAVLSGRAVACDLCGCNVLPIQAPAESAVGLNAGVVEQFTHFGTIQVDGEEVDNPAGQYLESSITQFHVGYQRPEGFGVQVVIPYIDRSFRRPHEEEIDEDCEAGLGDMMLIANGQVFEHRGEECAFTTDLFAGVKFPTGDSDRLEEEVGEHHHDGVPSAIHGHDLALGSGSFDGVVGGQIFGSWDWFFGTAQMQYFIRTEGAFGYRYANDLMWNGGPGGYLWREDAGKLGLQLYASGESKPRDTLDGVEAADTAVTFVYLGPQLIFVWNEQIRAEVGVDLPVVENNSALQIVPDYRIRGGVRCAF